MSVSGLVAGHSGGYPCLQGSFRPLGILTTCPFAWALPICDVLVLHCGMIGKPQSPWGDSCVSWAKGGDLNFTASRVFCSACSVLGVCDTAQQPRSLVGGNVL